MFLKQNLCSIRRITSEAGKNQSGAHFFERSPYHKDLFELALRGKVLGKQSVNEIIAKHGVSRKTVWKTYYALKREYPKLFPKLGEVKRKRADPIVQHWGTITKLLLAQKGEKYVQIPSLQLAQAWGIHRNTITREARRIRLMLINEGHKIGKFDSGKTPLYFKIRKLAARLEKGAKTKTLG
ncbi:MAG: hypothetical protein NTY48_05785 [Candidatus Diapherotrites archaeon]|nr:hypothetical protein [Candidatus Diapherotrites archaeon]